MNQKKSRKILVILIIILIIVIILAGLGIIYFTTDLFRNNKTTFSKYISQVVDEKQGFIENQLKQYIDKKKNTPYLDEGTFTVKASKNQSNASVENLNNMKITYSGKVNNNDSKNEQDITINYSDAVNTALKYKQAGNKVAVKSDVIGSKYVGIEADKIDKVLYGENASTEESSSSTNIDTIANGLGVDSNSVINAKKTASGVYILVNDINQNPFSAEEISSIGSNIMSIISSVDESKFSSIKDTNGKGYKFSVYGDDLKNVTVQFLQKLSQDQNTIDKLNKYISDSNLPGLTRIKSSDIEKEITDISNNSNFSDQKLEITVYKKDRKLSKIIIATNEINIEIGKEKSKNNLAYNIQFADTYENQTTTIPIKISFTGLNDMQKVNEVYEFGVQNNENNYTYHLENNIDLTQGKEFEDFTSENSVFLTDNEDDVIQSFIASLVERLKAVNQEKMEQLGCQEGDNPFNSIIPSFGNRLVVIANLGKSNINQEDVNTFNYKFEVYESTNQPGGAVKGLMTTIDLNNESNESERKIDEINFNGEEYEATSQNLANIKEDIKIDSYYRVEFEKDQNTGLIYRVVINPK